MQNLPEGYTAKYTGNDQSAVGTYTVLAKIYKGKTYVTYMQAKLIIEAVKEEEEPPVELLKFEGIVFESKTFPCDGNVYSLTAENVPDFATITYYNNAASQPLESKTVRVTITAEGYEALFLTATLSIGKGTIYVTANDYSRTQYVTPAYAPTAVLSYAHKSETYPIEKGGSVANCTGTLSFTYPATTRVPGEYDVTPAGLSSDMYDIVFVPGKYTVAEVKTNLVVGGAKAGENGTMLYGGKEVHTVGVNYYSMFNSLLKNPVEGSPAWQKLNAGMDTLQSYGVRVIRFNCGVFTKEEAASYYFGKEEAYYQILDRLLDRAAEHDLLLIPAMFWNDTWILNYYEETFNEAWSDESSNTMQLLRKMTEEIVTRYQHHPAIFAWEFGNENNLSVDLPNWENHTASVGRIDTQIYSDGMARWSEWVLAADEYDRMIMTGDAQLRAGQYSTYLNKSSWGPDSYEQHVLGIKMFNPGEINGVSVHIYGGYADQETPESVRLAGGKYLKDREDLTWKDNFALTMQATAEVAALKEMNMAAYVGECGVANGYAFYPGDTKEMRATRQRGIYDAIGQAAVDTGMPVSLLWNYDPIITIYEEDYAVLNPDNLAVSEMETAVYQKWGQHGNGTGIEWSWNENHLKGKAALESLQQYNAKLKTKYGAF